MTRAMGLDVGDRKIGVSLSDPSQILATPLNTIIRSTDDIAIKELIKLANKHNVSKIVVGLPYSLDGTIGKQAEKVLAFTKLIEQATDKEIVMQDERLTSVSADQKLREAGKKGSKLKREMDAAAATVILQAYLDEVKLDGEISQLEPPSM
ncbi:MAG: Holliday junction resolvase RuvX [Dehalococcoidia bacterium]|nr:Holliday junction resolvase RuvX [Dehalococcoidia bacterium]